MRPAPMVPWLLATAVALTGVRSVLSASRDRMPEPRVPEVAPPSGSSHPYRSDDRPEVDSVWASAPFRADRTRPGRWYTVELMAAREAEVAHAAAEAAAALAAEEEAAALAARRPPWTLTGVILGGSPLAVFDGTGSTGVLGIGDEVDGFIVTEIDPDSVLVSQDEHSWTFFPSSPWR